jgi:FG-GAP-like repeat
VIGTGDFNGDGMTDSVWSDNSGNTSVWLMNGAIVMTAGGLGSIPTSFSLAQTGDYNGDGMSDLLWRDGSFGNTIDAVYANGTTEYLSNSWAAWGGYDHFWTPQLHTSVWGGLVGVSLQPGCQEPDVRRRTWVRHHEQFSGHGLCDRSRRSFRVHQRLASGLAVQSELGPLASRHPHHMEPASRYRYRRRHHVLGDQNREPRSDGVDGTTSAGLPQGLYTFANLGHSEQ